MSKNCQMCGKFFKPFTKRSKVCPDKECKRQFRNWQADQYRIRDGKVRGEVTRDCDFCGKTYTSGGSRPWGSSQEGMYRPKYCSNACAKKREHQAKLDRYIKQPLVKGNCIVCGTEFTTNKPNSKKAKKTCSPKCANQVGRARQHGTSFQRQIFVKHCAECGGPFEIFKYAKANGEPSESGKPKKYCSRKCWQKVSQRNERSAGRRLVMKTESKAMLDDQYIIEQIQKGERRRGRKVTPNKEIPQSQITLKRISILVHRGEQLDKDLSNQEKIKQFEKTLTRTLRGNTAILPK